MLIQSTPTSIRVLPALPQRWAVGSLKGVRTRGGAQIDIGAFEQVALDILFRDGFEG